ncbi:uncharacterized protein PFL1_05878 [Pseudozyma flocculosa PF-1]|uniref:Related to GPI transamidase component PIG-S n=2 Tax=Pseudozyma flocculosa TaxID=84751 RepID=A0A5C3F1V6_9BASI|nr:uncharacterized protein PFL1_05878 [Pseudozyma flocculosa PF-1]EPQ26556.1 hypothetical protein PFL1_05878 [Pseudozyma flocculosa PF-1]SPO38454.1 related to GPI transamidase component PIG-S [Pseudozyma flocculosa]
MAPSALSFQSLGTRTAIILSFWSAILLSVPFWLQTTNIVRLPLPSQKVAQLERERTCPVRFRSSLNVQLPHALHASPDDPDSSTAIELETKQLLLDSLELKSRRAGIHGLACTDWTVTVQSQDVKSFGKAADFDFLVLHGRPSDAPGISEDGFVIALPALDDAAAAGPDIISAAVVQRLLRIIGQDELPVAQSAVDAEAAEASTVEQDPRVIQYNKDIRLVFSLMNEDATQGDAWSSSILQSLKSSSEQGTGDVPTPLGPITALFDELHGLHDFHVESQVQWLAPLQFKPTVEDFEIREESMVEETYEEAIEEEVEEDEAEGDGAEPTTETTTAPAANVPDATDSTEGVINTDEAEVEALLKTVDDVQSEEAEVDAILGSRPESAPAPLSSSSKAPAVAGPRRRRTITRHIPRTRLVPRVTTRNETRRLVEWDDLKVFVNSAEWSLSSTVAPQSRLERDGGVGNHEAADQVAGQTHDLHFLIYVPSASNRPLQIRDPETGGASDSNAWLIPQWGGVVILNPSSTEDASNSSVHDGPAIRQIPSDQLRQAMELFAQQLEILVGFPRRQGDAPFSQGREQRLDALLSKRILENARETVETLAGIVRLVDKIENLGVGEEIRKDVDRAIEVLESLKTHLERRSFDRHTHLVEALRLSYTASTLASRAFFSPKMLGLLYFPDEHKYAVYTPLFGPLLVPLVVALIKCIKEWTARIREARRARFKARASPRKARVRLSTGRIESS